MTDTMIPLTQLASEWGVSPAVLVRELGADRIVVDHLGIRYIADRDAAELLARRRDRATRRAEADEAARAAVKAADTVPHFRARSRALERAQHEADLKVDDLSLSAAAHLTLTRDHHVGRQAESAARLDEFLTGDVIKHPLPKER